MKKQLPIPLLLFILIFSSLPAFSQVIWQDDIDSYINDSIIDPQSTEWVGWGNAVTSAYVSDDTSSSPTNSIKIWDASVPGATVDVSDILHVFPNYTSGRYMLKFKVFVPSNVNGSEGATYWNIQHVVDTSTNTGQEWAFEVQIRSLSNPTPSSIEIGGTVYPFQAKYDQWVDVVHIFDLDRDQHDFFYDGNLIASQPFSYQAGSTSGTNQLAGLNLFANCDGGPNCVELGYFDDFEFLNYPLPPNDAGVLSIDSPKAVCAGNYDVYATIGNFGASQLNQVTVNWEINGVPQSPVTYSQMIDTINGSGSNTAQVFLGNGTFQSGSNTIKVYTSNPNSSADTTNYNDTLTINLQSANPPNGLTVHNTNANDATFIVDGSTGTIDYEYGTLGFNLGNGTPGTTSNDTFTVSGLSPSTSYDIYIRNNCGASTSAWIGPFTFLTTCVPINAPLIENFDASSTPNCWVESGDNAWDYSTGAAYGAAGADEHTGNGGNAAWMDGSSNSNGEVSSLTTVPVDLSSVTNPELNYWVFYNNTNSAARNLLEVEFYDGSNWHLVDTIQQNLGPNWVNRVIDLSSYIITGPTKARFTVTGSSVASAFHNDIVLDDIKLWKTPTCFTPNNFQDSNITANSVDLNWIDTNIATQWEIEYGTSGFTQGTGNFALVNSNPYTLTGLNPSTSYEVYIRAVCGRNDTSIWAGPIQFITPCLPMTAPYSQNFDSVPAVSPFAGVPCWTTTGPGANDIDLVTTTDNGNISAIPSSPNAVELNDGIFTSDTSILASPQFSDLGSGQNRIRFKVAFENTDLDEAMYVGVMSDPNTPSTFIPIDTINSADIGGGYGFAEITINLMDTALYGNSDHVAFAHGDGSGNFELYLDDFHYEPLPSCIKPEDLNTNVTTTTANLTWTEMNVATQWEIEYDSVGFTFGTGNRSIVSSNPTQISGLTPGSTYEFYVRSVCGRNDTSLWVGPFTFNTAYAVPYVQDFESFPPGITQNPWPEGWSSTTISDPNWESEDATGSNENSVATGPLYDHTNFGQSGGMYIYMETSSGTTGDSAFFISPPIHVDSSQQTLELNYWYFLHGADIDQMDVIVRSNGMDSVVATYIGQQQSSQTDPWLLGRHVLTGYAGSTVQIIFKGLNAPCCSGDLAIDDVSLIELKPNDAGVTSLASPVGAICPGTVTPAVEVTNTGSNTISTVDVIYSINGVFDTIPFTGTILPGQSQIVSLNPVTFSAGTSYDIEIYTSNPNGMPDPTPTDDTLSIEDVKTGLNGNYTIDASMAASATNYQDFSNAAADLNSFGVCGPVHFDVAPGTYTEQVTLEEIAGLSSTNTLVFDGTDSSIVTLSHDATVDRPTLLLNGTDYVTVQNMTIEATGATGTAVHLMNQANNNLFTNNVLRVDTTSTSSSVNPIVMAATTTSYSEADVANYTTFANNLVQGGFYQIRIEGDANDYATNLEFLNNKFELGYYYGVYADNLDSLRFKNNTITSSRRDANGDGFYSFDVMNFEFEGNYIHAPDYGFYISDANSDFTPMQRASIVNNMIISDSDYGMLLYDALDVDIFHNSISTYGSNPAVRIDNANTDNVDIRNNVFVSQTSEALLYDLAASTVLNMDNNIYHSDGSTLIDFDGTTYADLASFQAAYPALNANSLEGMPNFAAYEDLHMVGNFANNKGDNSVGVANDIDGDPRPIGTDTIVDIGADEYETITCPPPSGFTAFNEGLKSVFLTWVTSNPNFELEYGSLGFTQGNGTIISGSNDTVQLTGLTPSSTYEYYLRSICAVGDTSPWVGPFDFRTLNGLPFVENFESFPPGITSNPWPKGWVTTTSTDPNWESEDATGANENSTGTGPLYDHTTFGTPGGIYMYMETSSGTTGDSADLVSPEIYIDTNQETFELEYWYFNHGDDIDRMEVLIDTNGVTNLIASYVGEQQANQTDPWLLGSHYLTGYEGKTVKIIFRGFNAPCCSGDLAVDDVSLVEVPPIDAALTKLSSPVEDITHCYTAAENVAVDLSNIGLDTIDFTVDTTIVTVNVSGATTATLTDTINDNSINGSPLAPLSNINVAMGTLNMTTPGTYYFDISISMGADGKAINNTLLDTVIVTPPTGGSIAGPDSICAGDTVALSVDGYIGDIQWQSSTGGAFTDIAGADSSALMVTPGNITDYRVVACGTAYSDTLSIEPISLTQPIAYDSMLIVNCGDTGVVALTTTSTNPNATFEWFDVPVGGTALTAGGNIVSISPNGDTLYYQGTSIDTNNPAIDTFYVQEVVEVSGGGASSVLITEADLQTNDALEIQNVSSQAVNVNGWTVAISDDYNNINQVNGTVQTLSGTLSPGQILTWDDNNGGPIYWGSNLFWNETNPGWAIIIDDLGNVVDFVAWNWNQNDIYSFNTNIGGYNTSLSSNEWVGTGVSASTINTIERMGNSDSDEASDFSINTNSLGNTNANLTLPFPGGNCMSARDTAVAIIDCIVGVDEVQSSLSNISIHPNPSKGIFHIVGNEVKEDVEISIFNSNGKVVYRSSDKLSNNFDETIDISGLAKGMYFVRLQSETSMEMKKIVVQ